MLYFCLEPFHRSPDSYREGGKSGQLRAPRFLTGRVRLRRIWKVPQRQYRPPCTSDKASATCGKAWQGWKEWGKSPQSAVVTSSGGKPRGLKGHVNRGLRAARSISEGRLRRSCRQRQGQMNDGTLRLRRRDRIRLTGFIKKARLH